MTENGIIYFNSSSYDIYTIQNSRLTFSSTVIVARIHLLADLQTVRSLSWDLNCCLKPLGSHKT